MAGPIPAAAASPILPAKLLMVATLVLDELHVTAVVISCVLLSENVPIAVNCLLSPVVIFGFVGVTVIDINTAVVTVQVVEPETLPDVAVIVDEPLSTAVASPLPPAALLIVTTLMLEERHITAVVMSALLLSEKVPVAVN